MNNNRKNIYFQASIAVLLIFAGFSASASANHGDDAYCTKENPRGTYCYYDKERDECSPDHGGVNEELYTEKDSKEGQSCSDVCQNGDVYSQKLSCDSGSSGGWECTTDEVQEECDGSRKEKIDERCQDQDNTWDYRYRYQEQKCSRADCEWGTIKKQWEDTDEPCEESEDSSDCDCSTEDVECGGSGYDSDGYTYCDNDEMLVKKKCTDKKGDYCSSGVTYTCEKRTECGADQNESTGSGSGSVTNDECDSNSDCSGGTSCSYGSQCDERASKKVPKCQNPSSNSSTCTTTTTTSGCPTRNTDPSADYSYSQNAENIDYDGSSSGSNSGPSISSYSWTHGDGSSSSGQTVSHEYGSRGNYDTTLTVSNACGSDSETKNYVWIDSRGTEMDETQISSPSDRWGLDKNTQSSDKCVFEGSLRSESTTIDIGKNNKDLEQGGHSLDKEACVSDSNSGAGGRWFDKDTEEATDLIGGREINYYSGIWNTESLPAVEESGDTTGFETPIWGPYTEGERDDDHDGTGNEPANGESSKTSVKWNLWGIHNKIQDDSDQWDSGPDEYSSEPHPEKINKFAFTPDLTYSIDNTGKPYPPGSCYPRDVDVRLRTQVSDQSYTKEDKAFANSYAGTEAGDGAWKDPDDMTKDDLNFFCDITGKDLGIGHDTGGNNDLDDSGPGKEYTGAITFDDLGQDKAETEKPVCGDDGDEHLVGELGASNDGDWDPCNRHNPDRFPRSHH